MSAGLQVQWDEIVVLTISNPGKANSVTPDLVTEMARAFRRIEDDERVRAAILTGEGDYFCAGADITDMRGIFADRGVDAAVDYMIDVWMPSVQRAALAIWNCGKPTVAAINGPATAGGLDFALACDYAVAVQTAKLGESYINLGLLPVAAGIHHVLQRLPKGIARRVLLGGRVAPADAPHLRGLVDELVAPEDLMTTARAIADELSSAPTVTKRAYAQAFALTDGSFERQLAHALQANAMLLRNDDVKASFGAVLAGSPGAAPSREAREGAR